MKNLALLLFIIFFSTMSYSKFSNDLEKSAEVNLIKKFTDICYENRNRIYKISDLAQQLNWKAKNNKLAESLGIITYVDNYFTIMVSQDYETIGCNINTSNTSGLFGFMLVDKILEKFPPISNVYNTDESKMRENIFFQPSEKDIETNYIRSWYIEGGFKISVALTDLEYMKIGQNKEKYVSLQISRF